MRVVMVMSEYFEKLRRQAGILDPGRVKQLRIALSGASPALPYALYLLVQSGVGSPPGAILFKPPAGTLSEHKLDGHWLFHNAGIAADCTLAAAQGKLAYHLARDSRSLVLPPGTGVADVTLHFGPGDLPALPGHRIGVAVGPTGFQVGPGVVPAGPSLSSALTPALAAAAAALAVQQAFTLAGAIRPVMLEEFWLSLTALPSRLRPERAPSHEAVALTGTLGGVPLRTFRTTDGTAPDARELLRFALPIRDPRAQDLFAQLTICPWPTAFDRAVPERVVLDLRGTDTTSLPPKLPPARVFCGGVGGLGSWVAMLLAESLESGHLDLVDGDNRIERHNLNRQVLYRQALTCPKAEAAERALAGYRPDALTVRGVVELIGGIPGQPISPDLGRALEQADLVVACFDSFAAKAMLGELATQYDTSFVSGGAAQLRGDAQLVLPGEGCLLCRWRDLYGREAVAKMQGDWTSHSCSRELTPEDLARLDSSPSPTVALAGALQALLSGLALLTGKPAGSLRVPRLLSFDLGPGTLIWDRDEETVAPHQEHGEHKQQAFAVANPQDDVAGK